TRRPYAPAAEPRVAAHGDPAVVPRWKQRPWAPKPTQQAAGASTAAPRAAPAEAAAHPDYVEAERIVHDVDARADGAAAPIADAGRVARAAPAPEAPRMADAPAPAVEAPRVAEAPAPAPAPAQVADVTPAAADAA